MQKRRDFIAYTLELHVFCDKPSKCKMRMHVLRVLFQTLYMWRVMHLFYLLPQVIHNLAMWSADTKVLNYDQVKKDAHRAKKDTKMVRRVHWVLDGLVNP